MGTGTRAWLRQLSAVLLVAMLAGVVTLAVLRARDRKHPMVGLNPEAVAGASDQGAGAGDETVGVYTDFAISERVKGQLVFSLSSIRSLGLLSGWQEIEGVRLELFNEEGEPSAVLNCDAASYNIKTRDARLHGAIHVEFPDGGFMNTEKGHFDASSRWFVADSQIVFAGNGSVGQAGHAIYALPKEQLILEDDVIIRMEDGRVLTADRLVYDRARDRVAFPLGCRIEHGDSSIEAPHAFVVLRKGGGPPERIQLSKGVTLTSRGDLMVGSFDAWSEYLVAESDSVGNWHVTASTTGPWVEARFYSGPDFLERSIRTWLLRAVVGQEGILSIQAEQVVCLRDIPFAGSPRWAESHQARIWFKDRVANDMELIEEVRLKDDSTIGSAARARISSSAGMVTLYSDSSGRRRASLTSGRGRVTGDQVRLHEADGTAEARGNVQGFFEGVSLLGSSPEQGSDKPMHFAGGALNVRDDGQVFHLKEQARAWQSQRYLFADELILHQGTESLEAIGHVRTTIPAQQIDETAEPEDEVLIVARSLDYSRADRRATYRGNVRYTDSKHILSASQLEIELDDTSSVTAIEAIGAVDIIDTAAGRRMKGNEARRESATGVMTMTGSPVQLTDQNGNMVSGPSLTWDQASGRVAIAGGPDSQTETIYYPEDTP